MTYQYVPGLGLVGQPGQVYMPGFSITPSGGGIPAAPPPTQSRIPAPPPPTGIPTPPPPTTQDLSREEKQLRTAVAQTSGAVNTLILGVRQAKASGDTPQLQQLQFQLNNTKDTLNKLQKDHVKAANNLAAAGTTEANELKKAILNLQATPATDPGTIASLQSQIQAMQTQMLDAQATADDAAQAAADTQQEITDSFLDKYLPYMIGTGAVVAVVVIWKYVIK
jgi:hypothetical protein